ncbi:MarR family winged helix-turn-helix transcriptional regulator [Microbacterium sp. RU33B]|uniref:MarR family winged helix-turn-helix transcriptional regulator n=1 Tax=Microbacterium sp. RU33B TaxID=1907390 RepID=UPI00096679F5|nr:MarR family transcriptional regulator [Microbacterium sp. RU33B]SIT67791.1 transcriptional regulator, MarR family [Microbacterium sp. RU33B]
MHEPAGRSHRLKAFPAAAVKFSRALDRNRERIAEEEGLTASELRALFYVGEHIRVTPKQLASHMHVTTAAITLIARRLVTIGMLSRADHPDDRRSVILELTPLAHTTLERIHSEFDQMVSDATAHLDERQIAEFTRSLESVAVAVAEHTARITAARAAATI